MAEEARFQRSVEAFLRKRGHWFVKYWAGNKFTKSGVPDILSCVDGAFVGIELKAPKGSPSDIQLITLRSIDRAGGYSILLFPRDWDTFVRFIDTLDDSIYEELKAVWQRYIDRRGL